MKIAMKMREKWERRNPGYLYKAPVGKCGSFGKEAERVERRILRSWGECGASRRAADGLVGKKLSGA
jgi:hypothetical protein